MDFNEYQRRAQETDQQPGEVIVPLLGLAGEAGTLLSEYKKHLRDGSAHQLHKERVVEELGDLSGTSPTSRASTASILMRSLMAI
ncbi:MAG: nucleoside triphosphate pyrophosphohydrolase family protein [Dehalococcoidia bacterium]